jgi:hypothetical protein
MGDITQLFPAYGFISSVLAGGFHVLLAGFLDLRRNLHQGIGYVAEEEC